MAKKTQMKIDPKANRERMLETAMAHLERQFGKGVVMKLGQKEAAIRVKAIPTNILSLDVCTGIGGMPRGRIVEIFGPEASGKTTLALHVLACAQSIGGNAMFIDAEHALDPEYASRLGVQLEELYVSQPDYGEQALEIAETMIRSGGIDVIVIDSVAALVPKAELDGEMGDAHVGLQARLMSQALRKLAGIVHRSNTVLIFINQIRERIGVMTYANAETTTGGRALKFYSSMRIDVRRVGPIKQGDTTIGARTRVKIVKNKLAPPFKQTVLDLIYGEGFSRESDLIDLGLEHRLVTRAGAWFSYGEYRLGQGKEAARQFLKENKDIALQLENDIRAKLQLPQVSQEGSEKRKKEPEASS